MDAAGWVNVSARVRRLKLAQRVRGFLRVAILGAWPFWLTLLLSAVLLYGPALFRCPRVPYFRVGAVGLQIAGSIGTVWGAYETRKRFKRPSLLQSLKAWFGKLATAVLLRPVGGAGSVVFALTSTGTASVSGFAPRVSTTLQDRVAALEAEMGELGRRLTQFMTDSSRTAEELRDGLVQEIAARERAERRLDSLIEAQAASGLALELMGVIWILLGVLAGALPSQVASLLPGYPCA